MRPKTPAQYKIAYEISPKPLDGDITGKGGMPIISQAFRGMKLPGACDANLMNLRKIEAGYTPGQIVETMIIGIMLGADCVEDLDNLRDDPVSEKILGYSPASSRTVRDWLDKHHDGKAIEELNEKSQQLELKAIIPPPTESLARFSGVLGVSAREAAKRLPSGTPTVATIDLDATIVESDKRSAKMTYEGYKGYQPMVAAWAESNTILAIEFRDGNVPAMMNPLTCTRKAFSELPKDVVSFAFRGDSACDNNELLEWLDDENRSDGPKAKIEYAVSARMVEGLSNAAKAVPEDEWKNFGKEADGTLKQWCDLDYVPSMPTEKKETLPRRYIGMRFLKAQGELFADGHDRKHFAIITNRAESGEKVIEWHREKAGTIEHVHNEMKNHLAAGRLPSQKFGANTAWFIANAIAYNIFSALRSAEEDADSRIARIKRIRFSLFTSSARLTRFSRKITLRFSGRESWIKRVMKLLKAFPVRVQPTG